MILHVDTLYIKRVFVKQKQETIVYTSQRKFHSITTSITTKGSELAILQFVIQLLSERCRAFDGQTKLWTVGVQNDPSQMIVK